MNYHRKPINKVIDDVKLKMQLGALTLKISENNNKIDSLLAVDKNIIKDVSSNLGKISTNEGAISSNLGKIDKNKSDIASNLEQIADIKSLLPTSEIFKNIYSIKNQSFKFNSNIIFLNY